MKIPRSHPRYLSLVQRQLIEEGIAKGYVTPTGMIAHGRGEAFDYLLGERTTEPARRAEEAAVVELLRAQAPVISVNGNVAALCPKEVVELSKVISAKLEINLFYWSKEREEKISKILKQAGAGRVYGTGKKKKIPGLASPRGFVDPEGIYKADVVLVMLEDGDRTEALRRMGKRVIAIDLNPFSRTAQSADITIVDNITRALPNMIDMAKRMRRRRSGPPTRTKIFDNEKGLRLSIKEIQKHLSRAGSLSLEENSLGS